ncbi:MAG: hypothetical protein K6F35_09370 [Lachnospiraceae bacterium]|nr:hypothetical protein [Lachnospiraceae bacterium]
MRKLQKRFSSLALILIASMVLNPLTVMAKSNANPALVTKQKLVYQGTDTQVKNPVLVLDATDGTMKSITIDAVATLANSLSSDYLEVSVNAAPSSVSVAKIAGPSPADVGAKNTFKITANNEDAKGSNIEFIFRVKSALEANGISSNKNAKGINAFDEKKAKKIKLKVKVVKKAGTANFGDLSPVSSNNTLSASSIVRQLDEKWEIPGVGEKDMKVYKINTASVNNMKGKPIYTIPVSSKLALSGCEVKNLAFTTTNKKVATIAYSKKDSAVMIKLNRNAYTDASGIAEVRLGVGVKGTQTKIGSETVYAQSEYIKLMVLPDAKTPKVASASATVDGKKTGKASFVIGAGETSVSAQLSAIYSSNGKDGVTVEWTPEEKDEYKVEQEKGSNIAVLTVTKPIKKAIQLNGKVTAKSGAMKAIKVKITATKRVDSISDFKEKDMTKATASTYFGSNMKKMWINGRREYVRTFYYTNPAKAFADKFVIGVTPNGENGTVIPANPKLKAVKDASDSQKNNKSTITVKQVKGNKYSDTVALNVKPRKMKSEKGSGLTQELAIYEIVAADSYDKTTKQYGVGNYMAIALTDKTSTEIGDTISGNILIGTSTNAIIRKGDVVDVKLVDVADKDLDYVTVVSDDENVIVVRLDEKTYQVIGINPGKASIKLQVLGGKELGAVTVNVVDLPVAEKRTVYPGQNDIVVAAIAGSYDTVEITADTPAGGFVSTSISPNKATLSANDAPKVLLSANKANAVESGWETANVKVPVTAKFTIGSLAPIEVKHEYEFEVAPYEVTLNNDNKDFVFTIGKDGMTDLKDKITVTPDLNCGSVSLNYAVIESNDDLLTVSGTSVSPNSAGTGKLYAVYTDVNGHKYKSTAVRFTVEDPEGKNTYKNQTVVSFNKVTELSANEVQVSGTGSASSMKNSYDRIMRNLQEYANLEGAQGFEITLVVSGNTVSGDELSATSVVPEEEPEVEEAGAAVAEEAGAVIVEEADAAADVVGAEAVDAAEVEAADVAEAVAAVEPEEEAAPDAAEEPVPAEDIEEAGGSPKAFVQKTYHIVIKDKQVVKDGFTDDSVKEFIDNNFYDEQSKVTLELKFRSDKNVPTLLGMARQVYDKKEATFSRNVKFMFENGALLEFTNLTFNKGTYSVICNDITYEFKLFGTGDETTLVFADTYDMGENQNRLINEMLKVKGLVGGVTTYNEQGTPWVWPINKN